MGKYKREVPGSPAIAWVILALGVYGFDDIEHTWGS